MDYFYIQNEEKQGPVSEQEIIKLFREGAITEETLITQSGKTTWLPLKSILIKTPKKPAPYSIITTPMGLSVWGCFCRCLKLYCRFDGRGTRKEYWSFQLGLCLISMIFAIPFIRFMNILEEEETGTDLSSPQLYTLIGIIIFGGLLFLAFAIPTLASTWRRLHDSGRSGWCYFLSCIPFIGGLILFILTLMDSNKGDNKYGPSEKYPNEE